VEAPAAGETVIARDRVSPGETTCEIHGREHTVVFEYGRPSSGGRRVHLVRELDRGSIDLGVELGRLEVVSRG
jgi:hypothetical protein